MSVILACGLLREAGNQLDERTNVLLQQVTDDTIVVVVMANTIDTVHIVPDGMAKCCRVNVLVSAHPEHTHTHAHVPL